MLVSDCSFRPLLSPLDQRLRPSTMLLLYAMLCYAVLLLCVVLVLVVIVAGRLSIVLKSVEVVYEAGKVAVAVSLCVKGTDQAVAATVAFLHGLHVNECSAQQDLRLALQACK